MYACTCTIVNVKAVTRERNRRGEGERLRHELLAAAAALVEEHGTVDEVSLRAVAKRAGVSPMAVYNHFADRVALLDATIEHCWEAFSAVMTGATEGVDDPYDRLTAAGLAYVAYALEHPGTYRVLFARQDDVPRAVPAGMGAFDQLVGMVHDVLHANGDGRDPVFVAVQVHTWVHGIVDLVGCQAAVEGPDVDELLPEVQLRLGLTRP